MVSEFVFQHGRYRVDIDIIQQTSTLTIIVTSIGAKFSTSGDRLYYKSPYWSFTSNGTLYNRQKFDSYSDADSRCHYGFSSGDRITIFLDFLVKTIEYAKNGVKLGVAFNDLRGELQVAVKMLGYGDIVKLVSIRSDK